MLQPIPPQTKFLMTRPQTVRCKHCGREMNAANGTTIPYVGLVGPECRHKFSSLLALVADVEMLQFDIDDMGSQRLASGICATMRQIGFEIKKNVNLSTRVMWLEVASRKVMRRGDAMVKSWEQVRAEFEQRLQLAAAERDESAPAPYVPAEPVRKWSLTRFRGQLEYLTRRGQIDEAYALVAAYESGGSA